MSRFLEDLAEAAAKAAARKGISNIAPVSAAEMLKRIDEANSLAQQNETRKVRDQYVAAARRTACPTCGAAVGDSCKGFTYRRGVHKARIAAAIYDPAVRLDL